MPGGLVSVPMTGGQDGDHGRDLPQPLGVFCKARTYPNRNSGVHVIFDKVLEISKSGLLFGLVDGKDWGFAGHEGLGEAASQADESLESGNLARSDDSCMEDVWARALRLTR